MLACLHVWRIKFFLHKYVPAKAEKGNNAIESKEKWNDFRIGQKNFRPIYKMKKKSENVQKIIERRQRMETKWSSM